MKSQEKAATSELSDDESQVSISDEENEENKPSPSRPTDSKEGATYYSSNSSGSSDEEGEMAPDLSNLTELEKEQLKLDEYEKDQTKQRARELTQQMNGMSTTRQSRGKSSSRVVDSKELRRKDALRALKRQRLDDQGEGGVAKSRLSSDDEETTSLSTGGATSTSYERKRRRREQRDASMSYGSDDEWATSQVEQQERGGAAPHAPMVIDSTPPVTFNQARHYLYRSRTFFQEHFFTPFFNHVVIGTYVRLPIGRSTDGRGMSYAFCKVLSVCRSEMPYEFMNERTSVALMLEHLNTGVAVRKPCQLTSISGQPLRQSEFSAWVNYMQTATRPLPTHAQAKSHQKTLEIFLKNYTYTDGEIDAMVKRHKSSNRVKLKLGGEILRKEREYQAIKYAYEAMTDPKNYAGTNLEEAFSMNETLQTKKEELESLKRENEARSGGEKKKAVEKLNYVNQKNKMINNKRDRDAALTQKAEEDSMTPAQKLQYVRSNGGNAMSMSQSIIDRMVLENKLMALPNGMFCTLDKTCTVKALPDDLDKRNNVSPVKARKRTIAEKQQAAEAKSIKDIYKYFDASNVEVPKPATQEQTSKLTLRMYGADGSLLHEQLPLELLGQTAAALKSNLTGTRKRSGMSMAEYKNKSRNA